MDEVKKIEHYKILNTDTSENSAADLDSFLKKNKNKEMSRDCCWIHSPVITSGSG